MGGVCSFCRRANWWLLAGILGGPGPLGSIGRMSSSPCVSTIQHATPATSCWSISSISSSSSPHHCHQNANNTNANPTHVLSHKSQGIPCNWSGTMNKKGLPISYPVHFEQTSHVYHHIFGSTPYLLYGNAHCEYKTILNSSFQLACALPPWPIQLRFPSSPTLTLIKEILFFIFSYFQGLMYVIVH